MGYPRAYRRGSHKYSNGGFQNPVGKPTPGTRPPRPDNDNVPPGRYTPPPDPANDNRSGVSKPFKLPDRKAWPGYAADAADDAMRKLIPPPVRIALEVGKAAWMVYRDPYAKPAFELPGYRHDCGPAPTIGYNGRYGWTLSGSGTQCGLRGQAIGDPLLEPDPRWDGVSLARQSLGSTGRWMIVEHWTKLAGAPAPKVQWPATGPYAPRAEPEPIPYEVANPMPAYVPAPRGNELPAARPMPAKMPGNRPGQNPWKLPGPVVRPVVRPVNPGTGVKPGSKPGTGGKPVVIINPRPVLNPIRKPPGPGVKERKLRATGSFAILNAALSAASGVYEDVKFANDLIDAFYDALPKKDGSRTPAAKLAAIYRDLDKVNIEKAIIGVLIAVAGEKAGAYIDRARNTTAENLDLSLNITVPTGSAPRI